MFWSIDFAYITQWEKGLLKEGDACLGSIKEMVDRGFPINFRRGPWSMQEEESQIIWHRTFCKTFALSVVHSSKCLQVWDRTRRCVGGFLAPSGIASRGRKSRGSIYVVVLGFYTLSTKIYWSLDAPSCGHLCISDSEINIIIEWVLILNQL